MDLVLIMIYFLPLIGARLYIAPGLGLIFIGIYIKQSQSMNCYVLSDPGPSLKEYNVLTWSGTDFNIHIFSGLGTGLANSCIGSRQNRHWWKGRLTCRVRFRVFLFYIIRVDDTIASKKRVWIFIKLNIINPFDMFDEGRHDLFTWYDVNGALKEGCHCQE